MSDGDCATVMITNIQRGRAALYSVGEWPGGTDADVLLLEGSPAVPPIVKPGPGGSVALTPTFRSPG